MNVDSHLYLLNLYDLSRSSQISSEHPFLGKEIIVIRLNLACMQKKTREATLMDQAEHREMV